MKRAGFNGYVYDFSVDYDASAVDNIVDIHKYLMEKNGSIIKCLDLLKNRCLQINNFIKFNRCNFIKLYFNEQSSI